VPLFMQWPAKVDKSIVVTESVSHVDIFPTVFAAISQEADAHPARGSQSKRSPSSSSKSFNNVKLENAQLLMYRYEVLLTVVDKVFAKLTSAVSSLLKSVYPEEALSSSSIPKTVNMHIPASGEIQLPHRTEQQWTSSNASKPQTYYIRREEPRSAHALDGVNLLPLVTRQSQQEKDTVSNDFTDRVLYWRSGDYKAIVLSKWKLQVSQNPKKIWFFNLLEDPTEKVNIAVLIGIHNENDLKAMSGVDNFNAVDVDNVVVNADAAGKMERLLKMYQILLKIDSQQPKPTWPALVEIPVRIDSTSNVLETEEEEYVYWSN